MKNLTLVPVLLPTEDASILYFLDSILQLGHFQRCINNRKNQHLYLTSDAPIKEGDWFFECFGNGDKKLRKNNSKNVIIQQEGITLKKIEFTTNPKLIADGVPAIDGNTKAMIKLPYASKPAEREVNFLTEFCKRWNEKELLDAKKEAISVANRCLQLHNEVFCQKDNQEVDVEKLAENNFNALCDEQGHYKTTDTGYRKGIDGVSKRKWIRIFSKGYNQALQSQAEGFSLEDKLLKWIDDELKKDDETESDGGESSGMWSDSLYVFRNKIQSLTKEQPKADIVIECEMEEYTDGNAMYRSHRLFQPRLNKDGQPTLIFK